MPTECPAAVAWHQAPRAAADAPSPAEVQNPAFQTLPAECGVTVSGQPSPVPPAAGTLQNILAGKAPKWGAPGGGVGPRRLEIVPWTTCTFARNAGIKQLRAGTDLELGASELAPQPMNTMWRVWKQKRRVRRGLVRQRVLALLRTATWRATTVLARNCANQPLASWDCTFACLHS